MKKLFFVALISLMAVPAFSQYIFFEQDFRFPRAKDGKKVVPFSQMQWDYTVKGGFSMGPFFATEYGWNEAVWMLNYTTGPVSFGLGAGVEQLEEWSLRIVPWFKFENKFETDTTKSVEVFTLWEFGKGTFGDQKNYWYTNSVTYETSEISIGLLARRFYGVGPLFGYKVSAGDWNLKFSGAPLYDLEDNTFKPTVILTITN